MIIEVGDKIEQVTGQLAPRTISPGLLAPLTLCHKGSKYLVFLVFKSSREEVCILFIAMFTSIADVAAMLNVRDISCRVIVMIEPRM